MHSVEISSPRHVNKPSASAARHPPSSPSRPAPRRKVREGTTPPPPAHRSSPSPHPSPAPHIFPSVPPPPVTPRKRTRNDSTLGSPARSTKTLPEHLHHCLHAQKRACLAALRNPVIDYVDETEEDIHANTITSKQLKELLLGTVDRGEGNSCLVIGPRGSGKTRALASLRRPPIVIRLSGHAQHNDRLALREIARQLAQQTGQTFGLEADAEDEEDENPFAPPEPGLPPPSHLPTLISALPSLARSTVIILESFDLFALHGRQALLYCLLDTAQSCRAGKGSKGITIIGVTTRVDTINLLEKRVKSRFSGRMLRTSGPRHFSQWIDIARNALSAPIPQPQEEWTSCWSDAVEQFLADRVVKEALSDTFSLTRDVRMLSQILSGPMLALSPTNPYPTHSHISATILTQRCPPPFPFLSVSSYPAICLLIAAEHARIGGQDSVTFEMLHESFRHQLRTSQSAPVQVDGGGIGMAFEQLISTRVFVPLAAASATVGREFVRYRCMVEREDVKRAVEAIGQTNLRKWLHKAQ
ncbi:hypothetical protein BV25DRAFT_1791509 [Artomyces pyxidatus]|uniref:Uncharacterized protein n=1 Tax=Artomyces pyxidatus TaxID=48021 RepID=A0ACB8TK88_9AGAM|nr:hypothetical protein BV25DRAFT_1791509 [Artomyces pyxidatus]